MNELRGQTLLLRPLRHADLEAVFAILSDERTTAAVSWRQPSRETTEVWLRRRIDDQRQHGLSMWAVELLASAELVGLCGFFPRGERRLELGYVVHARHWQQGLATEAVSLAVEHVHGLGLEVFATIRPSNLASRRVAERAGLSLALHEHDAHGELLRYELRR